MKNPIRNVVVEYKNRRARKGSASLWGNLDLKSIAQEVDRLQSSTDAQLASNLGEPIERETETRTTQVKPLVEPATEKIVDVLDEREFSNIDAPEPKEELTVLEELQRIDTTQNAVVRKRKPSVQRRMKKLAPNERKKKSQPADEPDIQAELSALEVENVALKRELATRLHRENGQLLKMLQQLEQRELKERSAVGPDN